MSTFGATIERIGTVRHHPNADRLDLATLDGIDFQFIVGRDAYTVGDWIVYFPVDSVLPSKLIDVLGLTGKLSGKNHDRVKTIKLRGEFSQGLVGDIPSLVHHFGLDMSNAEQGMDVSDALGIVKYEPPEKIEKHARLVNMPEHVYVYDIEGIERSRDVVERLMDVPVFITEKMEGSHYSITYYPQTDRIAVCQRRHEILPLEDGEGEHTWLKVTREKEMVAKVKAIYARLSQSRNDIISVTIRGEMLGPGVQGNIYGFDTHRVLAFEIEVNGKPIPALDFLEISRMIALETVPVLHAGTKLHVITDNLSEYADGESVFKPGLLREGIVIRPYYKEMEDAHLPFGRVILKKRGIKYLAGSEL